MLVSVIVPVYNVEKYIVECIESLINQTYKDIEIVLVNDGSKDNSLELCLESSKKDDRIKVFSKENEGLGLTRNYGLSKSSGDFIVFIDSDDTLKEDAIEQLVNNYNQTKADVIIAGHNRITMEGIYYSSNPYEDKVFSGDELHYTLLPRLIGSLPNTKDSISMSSCGVLYKKNIIEENQLAFLSERQYISEDLLFNIAYFYHAKRVSLISYCGYNYRINQGSLTTSYRKDRFEKNIKLYYYEKEVLQRYGLYQYCDLRLKKQFFVFLRTSIKQEKKSISHLSISQIMKNIRMMVNDSTVRDIINTYPIHQLGVKQKVFIYLIKYQLVPFIYIFVELGVI